MNVKNLSWKQIKELAEMAMKNGNDFSLTLCADGDCSLDISKHDYSITSIPTYPSITYNNSPTTTHDINVGDVSDNPYKVTC